MLFRSRDEEADSPLAVKCDVAWRRQFSWLPPTKFRGNNERTDISKLAPERFERSCTQSRDVANRLAEDLRPDPELEILLVRWTQSVRREVDDFCRSTRVSFCEGA